MKRRRITIEGIVERIAQELINIHGNVSTQELAERIGISVSSVKHNLGAVREFFGEYGVRIISVPQKGLYVEATEDQREELRNKLQEIANKHLMSDGFRRDYIFTTVFRYQNNYTLQLLAEELYVSRNVISKDIKFLNSFLEAFEVQFVPKRNSGIVVEGHEFQVRQAMILYNNQRWWNTAYLKPPKELDPRISARAWTFISNFYPETGEELWKIQELLRMMESRIQVQFTDISFGRLLEYLITTRGRWKQNHFIDRFIEEDHLRLPKVYLQAAEIFIEQFVDRSTSGFEFEKVYLAARLYIASTVTGDNKPGKFRDVVYQYLEAVRKAVGPYYYPTDSELVDRVENLLMVLLYREDYRIYDWTDLSKEIRRRLPGLYAICMMHINILEEASGPKLREDDLARIVLLVHNYMRKRRKEAVLVTASNEEVVYYNLAKLKEEFPYLEFRGIINLQDFRMEDYKDILVISTVALKEEEPNVINITKHVTDADMECIRKRLPNVMQNGGQEILQRIFRKELIFDIVGKNKEDVLSQISERFVSLGYAEEGILEEILKREKILPTSVGKKVAVPHVYLKSVRKSGVAVARLKNSIDWSETERVKLIFFFAIGDEDSEEVKRIFAHMYNLMQSDEILEMIRTTVEHDKVVQILINCEDGNRH